MNKASLYIVGLGPGDASLLTPEALAFLTSSDVIAGYTTYLDLIDPALLKGKEIISTAMTGEVTRCEAAIDATLQGKTTSVVCSGDPGVYALAGLVLEMLEARKLNALDLNLAIAPGVPAVCAAAALAGAPLTHDFACVSLSDLLTPSDVIEKRLECALAGDFVLALYNPRSKRRVEPLQKALQAALRHRGPEVPAAVVRMARREGQAVRLLPLSAVNPDDIDMFTLIIIGNSQSRIVPGEKGSPDYEKGARMLTPRGYTGKYCL